MSEIKLSKDNDFLICTLYKSYLEKVKNGMSKSNARSLGSSDEIQEQLLKNWHKDDVATSCFELCDKGLLTCLPADDIAYRTYLTEDGIIYMENRKLDKLDKLIDYISKLKP